MKKIISGLILATLMSSTIMPTYAANVSAQFELGNNSKITQTYGLSFEQTISNINNTIKAINDMKAKGQVTDNQIKELANQIFSLEAATRGMTLSDSQLSDIASVLNSAESAINGLSNADEAVVAVSVVKTLLGIDGGAKIYGINADASDIGKSSQDVYVANNNYAAGSTSGQLTGTQLVNSFWDVKPEDWYYTQVQAMVQRGLFAGKGNVSEGVGTFAPNDTMTKAEFVTVVARMFYKDDEINNYADNDSVWWDKYYNACVSKGIFYENELKYDTMEQGMSREEMSFVAERTLEKMGTKKPVTYLMGNARTVIPDYTSVGSFYKEYVLYAYADGLLCGTDQAGTFNPKGTLTRAEASTVLYRIIEEEARTPNNRLYTTGSGSGNSASWQDSVIQNTGAITIKEYDKSVRRLAQEGDTVIKADGTKVVLKKGKAGIVGEGQGVAPDAGMQQVYNGGTETVIAGGSATNIFGYTESTGKAIKNQAYEINIITGEGHWMSEWGKIKQAYPAPTEPGAFNGQLSEDTYWIYYSDYDVWAFCAVQDTTEQGAKEIRQLNGLN